MKKLIKAFYWILLISMILIVSVLIALLSSSCTQTTEVKTMDYKFFRVSNTDYDGTVNHYDIISNRDARVLAIYIDCDQDSIRISDLGDTTLIWIDDRVHNHQVTIGLTSYAPDSCAVAQADPTLHFCVWAIPTDTLLKYNNLFESKKNEYQYDARIFDCDPLPINVLSFTYKLIEGTYHFYIEVADEINADILFIEGSNDAEIWTKLVQTKLNHSKTYHLTYGSI